MPQYFSYITGSATLPYSQSIAVPDEDTPVTAQSVREGFRTLADRTNFLSRSVAIVDKKFPTFMQAGVQYTGSSGFYNGYHGVTGTNWNIYYGSFNYISGVGMSTIVASEFAFPYALTSGYYEIKGHASFTSDDTTHRPFVLTNRITNSLPAVNDVVFSSLGQVYCTTAIGKGTNITSSVSFSEIRYMNAGDGAYLWLRSLTGTCAINWKSWQYSATLLNF